jgi:NAD(P)-dependent dehydrogenase (short-subunit alcohol dehydrogenase family)
MSDDRYNVSKLLVTLVARELAKQMDASANNQVVLNIVTPGFCKSQITRNVPAPGKYGVALMLFLIGRTTEMGSRTLVSAATAGKETHGKYLDSCRIGEPSPFVRSEEGAAVQVKVYAELMGILEGIEPCVTRNVVG